MIEMNRLFIYGLLFFNLLFPGTATGIYAQSRYESSFSEEAQQYPENLVVFTDRSIYVVNETIRFYAILQSGEEPYRGLGSKVLYAELVNGAGTALAQGKFLINVDCAAGQLSIPSNLNSGDYYLRYYTRWMRNFGPGRFTYNPLHIVNPYVPERENITMDQRKTILAGGPDGLEVVSCLHGQKSYSGGEVVELELSLAEGSDYHIQHGCVTVVPMGSLDTSANVYKVDQSPEVQESFQLNFLPEMKGTMMSGKIVDKHSRSPVSNARIHFSILGTDPAYFVAQSDLNGDFLVSTPLRLGDQEMFLIPEIDPGQSVEVLLDSDFATEPLPFRADNSFLKPGAFPLASRLSLHMQLRQAYQTDVQTETTNLANPNHPLPFYGETAISIELDEFIQLPNLEEVLENLVPKASVMRQDGRKSLVIHSENPLISMFPPLILVDHIPVFDMEKILSTPPSKIRLIEVVPEVYIKGSVKYGGIVSFTSRQGDLAGISFPEGAYFFDYQAIQPPKASPSPRFAGPGKIPDTRNTLFWEDHLVLNSDSTLKLTFHASSYPGTYLILFRGITSEGSLVKGSSSFLVN
jgi:hypothetical protein